MNPLRTALETLHDIVSDIVEDGRLTIGDGADAIPTEQYKALCDALAASTSALESEPRDEQPVAPGVALSPNDRIKQAIDCAQDAFWGVIAVHFPEATGGELGIDTTIDFTRACEKVVKHWLDANCRQALYQVGQYVLYVPAFPEQRKDRIAVVTEEGVEAIDPEDREEFEQQNTSPVCQWNSIEFIEPYHYADPDNLLVWVQRGHKLVRESRVCLQHQADRGNTVAQAVIDLHQATFGEF